MIRSILTTLLAATATFALALAVFAPAGLTADEPLAPLERKPALEVNGCMLTLQPAKEQFARGESPEVQLQAVNPTDHAVRLEVTVVFHEAPPANPMARMMPMPKPVYDRTCTLELAAGQQRVVHIRAEAVKPTGDITASMSCGDKGTYRMPMPYPPAPVLPMTPSPPAPTTN